MKEVRAIILKFFGLSVSLCLSVAHTLTKHSPILRGDIFFSFLHRSFLSCLAPKMVLGLFLMYPSFFLTSNTNSGCCCRKSVRVSVAWSPASWGIIRLLHIHFSANHQWTAPCAPLPRCVKIWGSKLKGKKYQSVPKVRRVKKKIKSKNKTS